ncbi:MAG: alpha-amylase family glycosyl hydrolase [Rikenellaceae bacterium]|nr:alpha-amylase family glycosyl hydrolase [Rikenellaceae bacterium]
MSAKLLIYQVLPRIFGNTNASCVPNSSIYVNGCGKLSDFTYEVLSLIKNLGCTHIWFTGIIEHATKTDYSRYGILKDYNQIVKGEAGSPYAIKDYYDIDPDLADNIPSRLQEFKDLIQRVHDSGMCVIIDFVPNHVARQYHSDSCPSNVTDFGFTDNSEYSFHPMNNFYYLPNQSFISPVQSSVLSDTYYEVPARASGNDCFKPNPTTHDWFETVKLNYGIDYMSNTGCYFNPIPDTWNKMGEILKYWLELGVDGFRCDMAEMVPVKFWKWVIDKVQKKHPDTIFIGEVYNKERYSEYLDIAGFNYLYDKVGLYDTLKLVTVGKAPANEITRRWQELGPNQSKMLNFIENHDEVRAASDFYAGDPYKAIPALTVSLMLNTAPFMIYFAQELGERGMESEGFSGIDGKTSIYDYWALKSIISWRSGETNTIRPIYCKLLNIATREKAVSEGKSYDLQYANNRNDQYNPALNYSFIRSYDKVMILIVVNFSDNDAFLAINIPLHAFDFLESDKKMAVSGIDMVDDILIDGTISSETPYKIFVKKNWIRILKFSLQ